MERDELPEDAHPIDEHVYRVEQHSIDATSAWDIGPALRRALLVQGPNLWVDLSRVTFIDSTGLGMLVSLLKEAREMDGEVRLVNAGREVRRILQVTGLEVLFEMNAGRAAAGAPRA